MMKRMLAMMAVILLAAAGCRPDAKMEARMKAMEERQEKLGREMGELRRSVDEAVAIARKLVEVNEAANGNMTSNLLVMAELITESKASAEAMMAQMTNKAAIAARAVPLPLATARAAYQPATPAVRGVPGTVYQQLAAEAARKWPGNFEMQEYTLKNQIESYRRLHP